MNDTPIHTISGPYAAWPAPGFPARLRQARELRGLTPAELDDLAGSSKGSCRRFEREDAREISALRFTHYARALRVAVRWLWTGEPPIDAPPPPDILGTTPDGVVLRRVAATIARRAGVPERVIYQVVTNPAYNTPDMRRQRMHHWVDLFMNEAIEPPNLGRAVAAFRWDHRLSHDDRALVIEGARRRATEPREDGQKLSIDRWRDLLRVSHLDIEASKIARAALADEASVLTAPPSQDACKTNAVISRTSLEVTFAALCPPWGGHRQECLVGFDAISLHAENGPGCVTVRTWPHGASPNHTLPTESHLCSAAKLVDFGILVLERQVALQQRREGGPITVESDWIDRTIARLGALRPPK